MKPEALASILREAALSANAAVPVVRLLEAALPVEALRELVRDKGVTPKGGFRLEKAPAKVLAKALLDPLKPEVVEASCTALAEHLASAAAPDEAAPAEPQQDLAPLLRLREQEVEQLREELQRAQRSAQSLREQLAERDRQAQLNQSALVQQRLQMAELQDRLDNRPAPLPGNDREQTRRLHQLERDVEELETLEENQRLKLAEQAGHLRVAAVRIEELEDRLRKKGKRVDKPKPAAELPEAARFSIPYFTPAFFRSLEDKDRRTVERAYQAVFLYCTEGPKYPGLQVKPLDPAGVWSLRASRKLRVYFRPRPDGDVDILELLDRQEQETALRRYREK